MIGKVMGGVEEKGERVEVGNDLQHIGHLLHAHRSKEAWRGHMLLKMSGFISVNILKYF